MNRYYSFKAYPINGFPKFFDSYKTKEQAMKAIKELMKDGYYTTVELYRDAETRVGYFGIERDLIETIGVNCEQ